MDVESLQRSSLLPNDFLIRPTSETKVRCRLPVAVCGVFLAVIWSFVSIILMSYVILHVQKMDLKINIVGDQLRLVENNINQPIEEALHDLEVKGLNDFGSGFVDHVPNPEHMRLADDDSTKSTFRSEADRGNLSNRKKRDIDSHQNWSSSLEVIHFEASIPPYNHSALGTPRDRIEMVTSDGYVSKAGFHPKGMTYKFWKPVALGDQEIPDFLHVSRNNHHFTLEHSGIYMIYAQVLYHDLSGRCAYGIYVNDEIRAQCTTSQHVPDDYVLGLPESHLASHGVYMNCHTSVVAHVEKRQRISIRSLYHDRTVVVLGRSTFWGMVKLKDLEYQTNQHS